MRPRSWMLWACLALGVGAGACTVDGLPYAVGDGATSVAADAVDAGMLDVDLGAVDAGMLDADSGAEASRDVTPEAGTDAESGVDAACPAGQTRCGTACVDLARDESHCGGCGVACASRMVCLEGRCGCEMFSLSAGVPMRGVAMNLARMTSPLCGYPNLGGGNALYFRVRVPARSHATFRAEPVGSPPWQPTLRVLSSCDARACEDSRTAYAAGGTVVLAVDNTPITARDYTVTVSPQTGNPVGALNMLFETAPLAGAPPSYELAMIPGACEDMAESTAVALGATGEGTSAILPLPFTFTHFGQAVTHFSATRAGFAQLWPGPMGTPLTDLRPRRIGETSELLPGVVAAFWEELRPQATTAASTVRTAAFGSAPDRRFVIEWNDWRFEEGDQHLRFQLKLREAAQAIEFHYCTLAPATQPRVLGAQAVVGIAPVPGYGGVAVSHGAPNAVSTASAFRLTPRM